MHIEVNGARLWFDVAGSALVPDGPDLRTRPTLVAIHGGPAGYDHSYLRPHLDRLADLVQVVYVDLPGHGRSAHLDASRWTLERCADDLREFCDRLGIVAPLLYGHSMGGFVALLYALRHPGHASGLLLQATAARHDVDRIVQEFRARFGGECADIAARVFSGGAATAEEQGRLLEGFGPNRPDADTYARITPNPALVPAMASMAEFDVVEDLYRIDVPTLITVGNLDPVTPVDAARELAAGLCAAPCHLEVLEKVGHFAWLDDPDRYFALLREFLSDACGPESARSSQRAPEVV